MSWAVSLPRYLIPMYTLTLLVLGCFITRMPSPVLAAVPVPLVIAAPAPVSKGRVTAYPRECPTACSMFQGARNGAEGVDSTCAHPSKAGHVIAGSQPAAPHQPDTSTDATAKAGDILEVFDDQHRDTQA